MEIATMVKTVRQSVRQSGSQAVRQSGTREKAKGIV